MVLGSACQRAEPPGNDTSHGTRSASSAVASAAPAQAPLTSAAAHAPALPATTGAARPLNVLLLTIDSLRADMPWTGYPRDIAPNLTRLAKQSVVYTHAYSVASYTAKSVAVMLTGQYPSSLFRTGWFFTGYSRANRFLAEALSEQGVKTLGWHSHLYFGRDKGLEQGFAEWQLVPGIDFDSEKDNHVTSDKMTALGMQLLAKVGAQDSFFAWAHYMDPHDVYKKHSESPDFGNKNRDRYDSEVFYADLWIGKLLAWAEQQPWWQTTALIISADHGEAFGEHGMYKHAFEVWDVLCRVPLIVHVPGAAPREISERRSLIDLAPTIMDLLGKKPLPEFRGRTLLPEISGTAPPASHEPIVLDLPEDSHNPPRRAIIDHDFKLIVHGDSFKKLLFDLKNDPAETKDLATQNPDKLKTMSELFTETFAKIPSVKPYGGMKLKSGQAANGPLGPSEKGTP